MQLTAIPQMVWCFLGVVGLIFTVMMWLDSERDLRALKLSDGFVDHGSRHLSALSQVRSQQQRCVVLACFTLVGAITLASSGLQINQQVNARSVIQAIVFGFAEITMVAGSIQDRRDRDILLFQIRARRVDIVRDEIKRVQSTSARDTIRVGREALFEHLGEESATRNWIGAEPQD